MSENTSEVESKRTVYFLFCCPSAARWDKNVSIHERHNKRLVAPIPDPSMHRSLLCAARIDLMCERDVHSMQTQNGTDRDAHGSMPTLRFRLAGCGTRALLRHRGARTGMRAFVEASIVQTCYWEGLVVIRIQAQHTGERPGRI
jgi:hypothetical protein